MRASRGVSLGGDASSRKYSDAGSLVGKLDNRLLKNHEVKRKHIETLEHFFSTKCPGIDFSPKAFVEPTGKDFAKMWAEIIRALNFKRSKEKKLEDQVVECLKMLRYPFTLSKTALGTPGATHNWPNVRAALVWVINFIAMFEQVPTLSAKPKGDFDEVSLSKHCIEGYAAFMGGDDAGLEQLRKSTLAEIESRNQALRDSIAATKARSDQVQAAIEAAKARKSAKVAMELKIEETKTDRQLLKSKLSQSQTSKSQCEKGIAEKQADLATCQKNMEKVLQDIAAVKHQVENQKYSKEDVERLLNEKLRVENQLETLRSHSATVKKEVFELEGKIQEAKFDIQQKVHETMALATHLKLIPASAKRAQGIDFSIEFDKNVPDKELECPRSFKSVIQPGIERLKTEMEKKSMGLRDEMATVEQELQDGQKRLAKLKQQHDLDEQEIQQINRETDSVNADWEKLKAEVAGKRERLEREILDVQSRCTDAVESAEAAEMEAKKSADIAAEKWNLELSEFRDAYRKRLERQKAIFQQANETVELFKKNCYAVVDRVEQFRKKTKTSHDPA